MTKDELSAAVDAARPQVARLLTIAVVAPALARIAIRGKVSKFDRWSLGAIAAVTIFYNWRNYALVKAFQKATSASSLAG